MFIMEELPVIVYFIRLFEIDYKIKFTVLILVSLIINQILKNYIAEKRPEKYHNHSYGMPSGHAHILWFIAFYKITETNIYLRASLIMFAIASSIQRLYSEKHTKKQVIMGGLLGMITGILASKI